MYACAVVPLGMTIEPSAVGHCAADVATTAAALALPPLLAATAGVRALRPGRTEHLDAAEMRRWAALGHHLPQEALEACAFGIAIKLLSIFVPPRTFVITPSRWFWEPREESDEERRKKLRRRRWLHQYDDDEETIESMIECKAISGLSGQLLLAAQDRQHSIHLFCPSRPCRRRNSSACCPMHAVSAWAMVARAGAACSRRATSQPASCL